MPVYSFNEILEPNKKQTQLDTVVTVENCYYYMSLLCSFYELERSMTSRAFSLFLAAAEKRYIEFMCSCHTENSWDGISHVPLYIAYAWHAHLLSPFRYYEDVGCGSNGPSEHLKLTDNFPLKEMHLKRTRDKPGDARLAYIAKQFSGAQSPTPAEKGYRSPYLRCNSCSEKLFFNSCDDDKDNEEIEHYSSHSREFANIIRSTYKSNPTGLSIDLVQAMVRQRDFIRTMVTKVSPMWKDPPKKYAFPTAIRDYHDFLLVIKSHESDIAIHPTPIVGRLLNHDDVIPRHRLEKHFAATEAAWKNIPLSLFDRGIISKASHSARGLLQSQTYVYDTLQETLINQRRWRRIPGKTTFGTSIKIEEEGLSYHGLRNDNPFDWTITRTSSLPNELSSAGYQEVFESIEHTGYGYIGSVADHALQIPSIKDRKIIKALTCPPEPPSKSYIKRSPGPIPLGTTTVIANGQLNTKYSGFQRQYAFPQLRSDKYQWWMPQYHYYGAMRRKYSKKHNQWGWTSNGFDWYSEHQCRFRVPFKGRFEGKDFRIPCYLVEDRFRYKNGVLTNDSIVDGICVSRTYYGDSGSWLNSQWLSGGFIEGGDGISSGNGRGQGGRVGSGSDGGY